MFIYSLKASTLKFFGIIGISLAMLVALIFLIPTFSSATTANIEAMNEGISFDNVKNAENAIEFLNQYGWELDKAPVDECEITIPKDFDKIMTLYNEIQKQQGLDLTKYQKKSATRYTFKVTNYPSYEGTVYANVIVYRNKVIAGDICSADSNGFMHTLYMPSTNK